VLSETRTTPAVGTSLTGIALRGGAGVLGVLIDNPSGAWLRVMPRGDYVPPYTMGWSRGLDVASASIDVLSGQAPAGQVTTTKGDPWSVTLYDTQASTSDGGSTQFTGNTNPTQAVAGITVTLQSANAYFSRVPVIAPPPANQRVRVFLATCYVVTSRAAFNPAFLVLGISTNDGATMPNELWRGMLTPGKLSDAWTPPVPYDLPLGYQVVAQGYYINSSTVPGRNLLIVGVNLTYQVL
jgi:hypothetical protein